MRRQSGGKRTLSVYSNLSHRIRQSKDYRARMKAERLAKLPKAPVKRFFYRLHPKRQFRYWFSREGGLMMLKVAGVGILAMAIFVGGVFLYFRQELQSLRPEALANRVHTTVTTYLDRDGDVIWKDKGTGNYKIAVDLDEISIHMQHATIALEDQNFYDHPGISISGIMRAAWHNLTTDTIQGGSTLTQQLVKKVFFTAKEASQRRGIDGYVRKIKEAILAIEVERMYTKDQILNMYLNTVPYGGRRNGVESAARTYFGISADKLNIAQAALLASIPQNPSLYNPYYKPGNEALLDRQRHCIRLMVEEGYITKQQAKQAKSVFPNPAALQSKLKPLSSRYKGANAPHFLIEVRQRLIEEFGHAVVGKGGLTVKTTLSLEAQKLAEKAVDKGVAIARRTSGADTMALVAMDVETGQIIAMVGSPDFGDKSINGSVNYATRRLAPGSSIKIYDYATLMKNRQGRDFGAGSILVDENIDEIYCAGSVSGDCTLQNYTGRYYGEVTIRQALGSSLNIPAVKAVAITGIDAMLKTAHQMGAKKYCTQQEYVGLSAAIGGGCTLTLVGHTAGYATLARGGIYQEPKYILKVTNAQGEVLKKWDNDNGKRVLNEQIAYMLSDILTDPQARTLVFASGYLPGFEIPQVPTAVKTGTTDNGRGMAKDSWIMSYSPAIAVGIWAGMHNGTAITSTHAGVRQAMDMFMEQVHMQVYKPKGKWNPGDWFKEPPGIKHLTVRGHTDIFPSWYNKEEQLNYIMKTFDKVSKKLATKCTPKRAKVEKPVQVVKDLIGHDKNDKKLIPPVGYSVKKKDDVHECDDNQPSVYSVDVYDHGNEFLIEADINEGTHNLKVVKFIVAGDTIDTVSVSSSGEYETEYSPGNDNAFRVKVVVIDKAYYADSATSEKVVPDSGDDDEGFISRHLPPARFGRYGD